MMNTMIKKSPNLVTPNPRRNDEIGNDDGIINPPAYSPEYSVASPISSDDLNSLPLAPAVLIEEHNTHSAEEGRLPAQNSEESHSKKTDSRFNPFRPIHPQCNHISYRCLTMVFIVFVGMAVLLKKYLPDILPPSISTEPSSSPSFLPTVTRSNPPSMYHSPTPSISIYEEKKLVISDGRSNDKFGSSCSISDDSVVVGAPYVDGENMNEGAAYLFHMDGTEVAKLTPGEDGEDYSGFGGSVAIDEKIVVGTWNGVYYVRVFSHGGIYERTIRCDDCTWFGRDVATLGNLIVIVGFQNSIYKLFLHTTEGELLKSFEQEYAIYDVAMSEQFIVMTALNGKTIIHSDEAPDFPKITEINQGGSKVAVSDDRIVIGNGYANSNDGEAYLYKTDGTLIKTLDRQDASSESYFGWSVAITDDKVIVGALYDNDQGYLSGSVFIYSAVTGEFLEKVLAPDGNPNDNFGRRVCASDSYYVVGATGVDSITGAAYLFQFSEE